MASMTVTAKDGTMLPVGDLAQVLAYSGSQLTSITVMYPSKTSRTPVAFVQTMTYTGSNLTGISQWVNAS